MKTVMWCYFLTFLLCFRNGLCTLWPKGVVHFTINTKDYDIHSQDIILSTFAEIEKEICVKFFNTPANFNSSGTAPHQILYINNPDKRKECPPDTYDFTKAVIDMPVGYKCINQKNIARIVTDMLRASIIKPVPVINSNDLIRIFQEQLSSIGSDPRRFAICDEFFAIIRNPHNDIVFCKEHEDPSRSFLINPKARNFINANYHSECRSLSERTPVETRRSSGTITFSEENQKYYKHLVWPLGILMYGVEEDLENSEQHTLLKYAMTTVELASCIVFQEVRADDALKPNNLLWFGSHGAEVPHLGFKEGNQTISLQNMVEGEPGHTSHSLNVLLRALGMPMVSNRPDRDNYININWHNVQKGKEHYLEKIPASAWVRDARMPYDFNSATHAPANFVCGSSCKHGEMTVEPANDNLWQRVLSMGHFTQLSEGDKMMLDVLYDAPCRNRFSNNK